MIRVRKYIALFSLLAFLLPIVSEGIHGFQHRNEFHCLSAVTHLHKLERHCALCDYTPTVSNALLSQNNNFLIVSSSESSFCEYKKEVISCQYLNISPRAPPAFI